MIFLPDRTDNGMKTRFRLKLTTEDNTVFYSQNPPMPIHPKSLIVELALILKHGIITVQPFSKYARPSFEQRKTNGKLRLLVDLRKPNKLIADDYTKNNHPVSTFSDAAQHLAGKSFFCKLDCFRAYHCLQMAAQRSLEMLASSFSSEKSAFNSLAQSLSRSVSAFSSFMRKYLDPVFTADHCAQYSNDTEIAAKTATDLTQKFRAVFECIWNAGLKLTVEKCHLWVRQVELLGWTNSPDGVFSQTQQIKKFLNQVRILRSKRSIAVVPRFR